MAFWGKIWIGIDIPNENTCFNRNRRKNVKSSRSVKSDCFYSTEIINGKSIYAPAVPLPLFDIILICVLFVGFAD